MATKTSAMQRLLDALDMDLPDEMARRVLAVRFTDAEVARHQELQDKVEYDSLTPEERSELADLLAANDLLTIMHTRARRSLTKSQPAA